MPQFRNILNRKPAIADGNADNNETSKGHQNPELLDSQRSGSLNIRKSREEVPEYKLSGMFLVYATSPRYVISTREEHGGVKHTIRLTALFSSISGQ
jgi:hypothetical protein